MRWRSSSFLSSHEGPCLALYGPHTPEGPSLIINNNPNPPDWDCCLSFSKFEKGLKPGQGRILYPVHNVRTCQPAYRCNSLYTASAPNCNAFSGTRSSAAWMMVLKLKSGGRSS